MRWLFCGHAVKLRELRQQLLDHFGFGVADHGCSLVLGSCGFFQHREDDDFYFLVDRRRTLSWIIAVMSSMGRISHGPIFMPG